MRRKTSYGDQYDGLALCHPFSSDTVGLNLYKGMSPPSDPALGHVLNVGHFAQLSTYSTTMPASTHTEDDQKSSDDTSLSSNKTSVSMGHVTVPVIEIKPDESEAFEHILSRHFARRLASRQVDHITCLMAGHTVMAPSHAPSGGPSEPWTQTSIKFLTGQGP